jgi:hypothetical protein
MGGFWPRICVVKKGLARDIYFLLQTRTFWHFSAPSAFLSLRAVIYSPVRQCLSSAVLAPLTLSSDLVVLPI